jgi:hypothetical protein
VGEFDQGCVNMAGQRVREHTTGVATYQCEKSRGLCLVWWLCTLERPSSQPIMLSAKRIVSAARRFPTFRTYSDAGPANNGTGQDLCKFPLSKRHE